MKKHATIIASLLLMLASISSQAQGPRPGPGQDAPPEAVLRVALELTEEQVAELRDLLRNRAEATRSISEQIRLLQQDLEGQTNSDAPDPGEIGNIVLDIRAQRHEVRQIQGEFNETFHTLLTPEQQERLGHIGRIGLAVRAAQAIAELGLRRGDGPATPGS